MKAIYDDLWFCEDCTIAAETGDASSLDYYCGDEADARLEVISKGIGYWATKGWLVIDTDEDGSGELEFSRLPCDCCGTSLAGRRVKFAVLGE